jgi:hypothetical protein
MMGELLCNAERHSQSDSDDGDWSTAGFMVRRIEGGESVLRCHLAFLSVGQSFAESLSGAADDVKASLSQYIAQHRFSGTPPEVLATLYALQDTITCDPKAREARSGGTGLQDVLDFVRELAGPSSEECGTRVTILSGRTCIALRHPYLEGIRRAEDQPRLLWCNEANSSSAPPDPKVAFPVSEHFAGTLVSVAFRLDPAYLASTMETTDDGDD